MKKYKIRISTSGMIEMSVPARSEKEAIKKAVSKWLSMDVHTLDSMLYVKFSVDGHEPSEVHNGIIHEVINSENTDIKTSVIDME